MVDIVYSSLRRAILFIFLVIYIGANAQEIAPRIAGLENNQEYMALLKEDRQLKQQEDSTLNAMAIIREKFTSDPSNRDKYSNDILTLETQIFDIRGAQGRIINKINTIEQDWVMQNIHNPQSILQPTSPTLDTQTPDSLKVSNLIYNAYFRENLPTEDYKLLVESQEMETTALEIATQYLTNYKQVAELATEYAATTTQIQADSIFQKYNSIQEINYILSDSLTQTWSYIFDNKNYSYSYLLETSGQEAILAQAAKRMEKANRSMILIGDNFTSKSLANYVIHKKDITSYEISIANLLSLKGAVDSLNIVATEMNKINYKLPKVDLKQRHFLDYDSISYVRVSPYTYKNPVPECTVYKHGTIYRILLGRFNTKRAVSIFRGAVPLSYLVGEDSKWSYFSGGFATIEQAQHAQEVAKKKGFTRPEIVVWRDSVMTNLSQHPEAISESKYRIEIVTTVDLSTPIKDVIATTASEYQMSRINQTTYIIGIFTSLESAQVVVDALKEASPDLQIGVIEIPK